MTHNEMTSYKSQSKPHLKKHCISLEFFPFGFAGQFTDDVFVGIIMGGTLLV